MGAKEPYLQTGSVLKHSAICCAILTGTGYRVWVLDFFTPRFIVTVSADKSTKYSCNDQINSDFFRQQYSSWPMNSSPAVATFLRPFGSKRPEVERPTFGRLPVAFPLPSRQLRGNREEGAIGERSDGGRSNWGAKRRWGEAGVGVGSLTFSTESKQTITDSLKGSYRPHPCPSP